MSYNMDMLNAQPTDGWGDTQRDWDALDRDRDYKFVCEYEGRWNDIVNEDDLHRAAFYECSRCGQAFEGLDVGEPGTAWCSYCDRPVAVVKL
jgi:DNA-directed RNA polymerase subunit RPC12/RpoP